MSEGSHFSISWRKGRWGLVEVAAMFGFGMTGGAIGAISMALVIGNITRAIFGLFA